MMNNCRTCLITPATKDISELEQGVQGNNKNYLEIMVFCLDIKVNQDSKITTNLCDSCYMKIISFYKFKALSLKNDAYLKSQEPKLSVYVDENGIKYENPLETDEYGSCILEECSLDIKVKEEDIKVEETLLEVEVDIKNENTQKYGDIDDNTAEPDNICYEISASALEKENNENDNDKKKAKTLIRNKSGRPKKKKLENVKQERPVCEECGKSVSVRNFKEHMLCHRPKEERPMLQCKDCPKLFSTRSGRYRHYRMAHLGMTFKCDICNKEVHSLQAHNKRVHDRDAFRFGCAFCDRRFPSKSDLDSHLITHTQDRPYECDECHKKFRSKGFILRHIQGVHEKQRTFQCQFCSKDFFSKVSLQRHIRTHTKERPYACNDCGKAFGDKSSLRDHRHIHTGIKSRQCPHCDMSFVSNTCLRKHLVKHTKEKRYPCQVCDKRFGRSDHRRRHELTAHKKKRAAD